MDHHCGFINSCICVGPGGSAKPFFLFALYIIALCLNGAILIARRSIEKGETWTSMQSPLKCTLMLVTTLLRHMLASTPYFDREALGLFPLDEYGKKIYPPEYKVEEASLYFFDQAVFVANLGFMIFVISVTYNILVNLRIGVTYPAYLKFKKFGRRPNPKFARSWSQVIYAIFQED